MADFIPMFVFFNIFEVFVLACKTLYNLVPPSRCLNPVTFYIVLLLPSGYISVADPDLHRGMCLAAWPVLLLGGRRKVVFGEPVHPRAMGVQEKPCVRGLLTSKRALLSAPQWDRVFGNREAGRKAKAVCCSLALPNCFKCD